MIRKMVIVNIWVEKFKIQKFYMFYKGFFFYAYLDFSWYYLKPLIGNRLITCRSKYVVHIKCPGRKIGFSLSLIYGYIDLTIVLVFPVRIFSNFDV